MAFSPSAGAPQWQVTIAASLAFCRRQKPFGSLMCRCDHLGYRGALTCSD